MLGDAKNKVQKYIIPRKKGKKHGKKKAFHGNQHTPKTKINEHVAAVAVSQIKSKKGANAREKCSSGRL